MAVVFGAAVAAAVVVVVLAAHLDVSDNRYFESLRIGFAPLISLLGGWSLILIRFDTFGQEQTVSTAAVDVYPIVARILLPSSSFCSSNFLCHPLTQWSVSLNERHNHSHSQRSL